MSIDARVLNNPACADVVSSFRAGLGVHSVVRFGSLFDALSTYVAVFVDNVPAVFFNGSLVPSGDVVSNGLIREVLPIAVLSIVQKDNCAIVSVMNDFDAFGEGKYWRDLGFAFRKNASGFEAIARSNVVASYSGSMLSLPERFLRDTAHVFRDYWC